MSNMELKIFLFILSTCFGVIAFFCVIGVKQLIQMAKDLNEIKTMVSVQATKHDSLERRVEQLENA